MVLDFGMCKGKSIASLCPDYIRWLCCCDVRRVDGQVVMRDLNKSDSARWLWGTKPQYVAAARAYVEDTQRCTQCCRKLVAIGTARKGGKGHDDWSERQLHRSCFVGVWGDRRFLADPTPLDVPVQYMPAKKDLMSGGTAVPNFGPVTAPLP